MMKYSFVVLLLVCFITTISFSQKAQKIEYTLSMSKPHTHYFEVEINISNYNKDIIDFLMPVWAPGSYLIREFPKNVSFFQANDFEKNPLLFEKTNKYNWRVYLNKSKNVIIRYKVYAFEMSVRTSFLDSSHGYLNGTSIFMYVKDLKDQPLTLKIIPYKDWKKVSTGLTKVKGKLWEYYSPNYDILADSPIEIGNQNIFQFTAAGIPHNVVMYGDGNYNIDSLKIQMARIAEAATNVIGENPNKEYTFLVHNLSNRGGGLEHLNSTTLQFRRWGYDTENRSRSFLGLVAHEYFHLWNVKRIRPIQLGPFDYQNENYTELLWEMEGVTSYYGSQILLRAGFYSPNQYLGRIESSISSLENQPGNKVQSAAMSSFDAWIKYYRSNENSDNTEISYYSKGAVLGMLLDLEIINSTNGLKSYDDVLRLLYRKYYKELKRGFTEKEFKTTVEVIVGKNMDDFFNKYVNGTEQVNYNKYLGYAGLQLIDQKNDNNEIDLGFFSKTKNSNLFIKRVIDGTPAYNSGLNVDDEIIAVNDYRIDEKTLDNILENFPIGSELDFLLSRDGKLMNIKVKLEVNHVKKFNIVDLNNVTDKQKLVYNKWLRIK
ncbi:MAG: peptidase M61 [Ignavibacteriales bacterium CG_4_9_14_3_um_filter_30_11]|nr:MAG: peptidase M61 [Ignavibacteriales bacterium CG_4_9_14_3_um_filter_30_11]